MQGEDIAQSDPNTQHVTHALESLEILVVQDLFLNETAAFAHVFLPGTSFLEKDGTFTNAERRVNRVRPVMKEQQGMAEWEIVCRIATAMGYPMSYPSAAAIMDEIAYVTPTFKGISFAKLDELGSVQWPCDDDAPAGTPVMHVGRVHARQGPLHAHRVRADAGAHQPQLPADPDHGPHPQPVQRRRADAAHRERRLVQGGHPRDASLATRRCAASRTARSPRSRAASAARRCA